MKIFIIGAGTIGKALAVCLKLDGSDVCLIRGSVDDGRTYTEKIIVEQKDGSELIAEIEFNSLSKFQRLEGLVVVATKSFGNTALAQKLKGKIKDAPLVILQNGLGVEQPFINHNFKAIFRGVLFATSQNVAQNRTRYKPVAQSPIGSIRQNRSSLHKIVDALNTSNFQFISEQNIQPIIWKKAIANCVFNSICPLLEIDNGIFHRESKVFSLAKRIIKECIIISKASGVELEASEVEHQVLAISEMSDGQFISTLQDIRNKRETEIDTLNLEIYRLAKNMNRAQDVKETALLGELIRFKSELSK